MKQRKTGKRLLALLISLALTMSMALTAFAENESPEQTAGEEVEIALSTALADGRSTSVASVSGGGSFTKGSSVTVSAESKDGLTFQGWYKDKFDGEQVSPEATYTFSATESTTLVAVYTATKNVSLTVTAVGFTVNDKVGTSGDLIDCPFGETVNLVYTGTEEFLYWKNASGKVVSRSAAYTFPIVSSIELTAVTTAKADQSAYVEFLSAYGQVMQAATWTADGTGYALPAGPAKAGCTFRKWSVDGQTTATVDSILQLIKDRETRITLNPVYKESKKLYTVTVNYSGVTHDVDSYTIEEGKSQLITAADIADATFSYWSDAEGNVLSYNRDYRAFASKDVTLYAVYNQGNVTSVPVIRITNNYAWTNGSKNMLSFEATRGIPSGYTLVEHGMLVSKTVETPEADQEGVIKLVSNDSAANGVYIANVSVGTRILKVYARGYMVVKNNATGEYQTVYSDSVTGNYPYLPQNRLYDVLQDFEGSGVDWIQTANGASYQYVENHQQSGAKSVKLYEPSDSWSEVDMFLLKDGNRLTEEDWRGYEYIKLYVYSENANQLYLYNHKFDLQVGENVLTISPEEIIAQLRGYKEIGTFWFQLRPGTIYLDSIIGVYPELPDTEKTAYFPTNREYDMLQDFEGSGVDWIDTAYGASYEYVESHQQSGAMSVKLREGSTQWSEVDIYLLKDGKRLTNEDWKEYQYIQFYVYSEKKTTFWLFGQRLDLEVGPNVLSLTPDQVIAQCTNGYKSNGAFWFQLIPNSSTIYVDSIIGVYPEDYTDVTDYFPTDRDYDTLQDFEGSGIRFSATGLDVEYGMRHHLSGTNAVKLTNNTQTTGESWKAFTMLLLKSDGKRLEEADWNQYESIKMYVYSVGTNTIWLNTLPKTLQDGENVIEISREGFYSEVLKDGATYKGYDNEGAFFCQLQYPGTIYIDSVIANKPYE